MSAPSKIYSLIPKIMAKVGSVSKDRTNDFQKYKFRGIEDMYTAIQPAFIEYGVFCAPEVISERSETIEKVNKAGEQQISYRTLLRIRHRFYAEDGSYVDVTTEGEGIDQSDKASNKAMSAAMKYAFIELFSIPTEDIADSDRESPEAGKVKVSGLPRIRPDQPDWNDGVQTKDTGYRIPFGKFNKRTLEEVPLDELRGYVIYLETKAEKDGKPIQGVVKDFIARAAQHIAALETA